MSGATFMFFLHFIIRQEGLPYIFCFSFLGLVPLLCRLSIGGVNCSDCTILGLFSRHGPVMVLFLSSHSFGTIITYPRVRQHVCNVPYRVYGRSYAPRYSFLSKPKVNWLLHAKWKGNMCLRSPHSKQPLAWFTLGTPL